MRLPQNKPLPTRWQFTHGAYYYRVPKGQESAWNGQKRFLLGHSLGEAHEAFGKRVGHRGPIRTVGQLLDRYVLEVVPQKAAKTRCDNVKQAAKVRTVFGEMGLNDIEPHHIYGYADRRVHKKTGKPAKTAAKREIEVLSHAFTKAVEWGLLKRHPFKGEVEIAGRPPRTRYVQDWEVIETLTLEPRRAKRCGVRMIKAYIRLKLLTALSKGDLLRLEPARHFKDDGIHVTRHKTANSTGKATIYEWTPERRAAVEEAKAVRPVHISPFLFCNAQGKGYVNEARGTTKAFDSQWSNYMTRVLKETAVTERFTEHDLRAKAGSDAKNLEAARALLAHADQATTQRIYRRKPERV